MISVLEGDRPFCCPMPNCRRRFATEADVKKHIDNHMNPHSSKSRRNNQINNAASTAAAVAAAAVAAAAATTTTTANVAIAEKVIFFMFVYFSHCANLVDSRNVDDYNTCPIAIKSIFFPFKQHSDSPFQLPMDTKPNNLIPRMNPTTIKHELYFPQCYAPSFANQSFGAQQGHSSNIGSSPNTTPSVCESFR